MTISPEFSQDKKMRTKFLQWMLLVVFANFCRLCSAKVGRHESINDLFTDEETFHYTQEHVNLRADIGLDQDAAERAFRYAEPHCLDVASWNNEWQSDPLSQESGEAIDEAPEDALGARVGRDSRHQLQEDLQQRRQAA